MRPLLLVLSITIIGLLFAGCSTTASTPRTGTQLTPAQVDRLCGAPWIGTLTYLDYTSGKLTTIDSSLQVRRLDGPGARWEYGIGYSKEPHADSRETLELTRGGTQLGDERIVRVEEDASGTLRYVTECEGLDDNRPASFRFEHEVSDRACSRRKMVRFAGTTEWFERHIYRWHR